MPDFSVPSWLQPPSEDERRKMQMLEQQVAEKSVSTLRRQIGMRRMQAEAQAAQANGVDPVTARQNALINNAHLLFADNPEQVSSIVNHQEANQVRERANLQLDQHRRMQDLLREEANKMKADQLALQAKHNAELDEVRRLRLDAQNRALDLRQESDKTKAELEREKQEKLDLRSQLTQKRLREQGDRNAQIRIEQMLQTDAEHGALVGRVTTAQQALDTATSRKGRSKWLLGTTDDDVNKARENLARAKQDLRAYRKKVAKRFNIDLPEVDDEDASLPGDSAGNDTMPDNPSAPAPPAAPAPAAKPKWTTQNPPRLGTIIRKNGQMYSYIGGDPNDADSWAKYLGR